MESAGFKMVRLVIWQKTNPVPLNMRATYLSNTKLTRFVARGPRASQCWLYRKTSNQVNMV